MNAHVSKVEFPRAAGLTVEYIRSWKLSHHKVKIRSIVTTPQRQLEGGGEGRRREGEGGREGEGERREGGGGKWECTFCWYRMFTEGHAQLLSLHERATTSRTPSPSVQRNSKSL